MPTLDLILAAADAVVLSAALFFAARPVMGIFQQFGYRGCALVKWYYGPRNGTQRRYNLLALCAALLSAILSLSFAFAGAAVAEAVAVLAFAGACGFFVYAFRHALKIPLNGTPRMIRLSVAFFLFLFGTLFGLGAGLHAAGNAIGTLLGEVLITTVPLALLPLFLPLLLAAANAVMQIYEIPHTAGFLRRARRVLRESPCVKVGITGSFGKTSVKTIAAEMLRKKYRVIATPASYNTPVGIAKCVNTEGLDCDVFLAEMGARQRGDITELADMVCPDYAIVTGVCPQHLETFGSERAIFEEKSVLAMRVGAGKAVLGRTAAAMREDALAEGRDFSAENIVCTPSGTTFEFCYGRERAAVKTSLLGRHAAEDIALAGALARLMGVEMQEIVEATAELRPVPHRLELLKKNGLNILDDSYNSNVAGAEDAVEVLRLFPGRKAVVTPGLVELGTLEGKANAKLGASFAGLDEVILVGVTRILSVRQGYLEAGGAEENLRIVPTLKEAARLIADDLAEGDAVLFLNDLPDKYL